MFRKRIGVFVCHCGSNIGGVIRIPDVLERVREMAHVVHVDDPLYACSEDGLVSLKKAIIEKKLNRVIIASCTPRTHESLFRNACEQAGLNKYLFEFVNIREHCTWIHQQTPNEATQKATELIRMGVAKSGFLEPQEEIETDVYPAAMVIGGGISGMTAALNLANQNVRVYLVEREKKLGGLLVNVGTLFPTDQKTSELIEPIIEKARAHRKITLHLGSRLHKVRGFIGDFDVELETDSPESHAELKVGTIVVATGANELKPNGNYGYGKIEGVLTQLELERELMIHASQLTVHDSVVMINCVGARVEERQYCGRFCCLTAMKNATAIRKGSPDTKVYILQRDVMAYGSEFERYYKKSMESGVRFIRYNQDRPPKVVGDKKVERVEVYHDLTGKDITIPAQMVVLTTPLVPQDDAERLSKMLKVPLGDEGFFLEAHLKLRPTEFATDGIYLCGCCRYPAEVSECVSQAYAASAKAAIPIRNGTVRSEAITAVSDQRTCSGCGNCVDACPFQCIGLEESQDGKKIAVVSDAECKGCGLCVAVCPNGAMQQRGFDDRQLMPMINALTTR